MEWKHTGSVPFNNVGTSWMAYFDIQHGTIDCLTFQFIDLQMLKSMTLAQLL